MNVPDARVEVQHAVAGAGVRGASSTIAVMSSAASVLTWKNDGADTVYENSPSDSRQNPSPASTSTPAMSSLDASRASTRATVSARRASAMARPASWRGNGPGGRPDVDLDVAAVRGDPDADAGDRTPSSGRAPR